MCQANDTKMRKSDGGHHGWQVGFKFCIEQYKATGVQTLGQEDNNFFSVEKAKDVNAKKWEKYYEQLCKSDQMRRRSASQKELADHIDDPNTAAPDMVDNDHDYQLAATPTSTSRWFADFVLQETSQGHSWVG